MPFAFNAGATQLPAGTYEIKVVQGAGAFIIQNDDTAAAAISIARPEGPRNTNGKLVFHRVGGQYFLAEIWKSSGAGGMIVPPPSWRRIWRRNCSSPKVPRAATEKSSSLLSKAANLSHEAGANRSGFLCVRLRQEQITEIGTPRCRSRKKATSGLPGHNDPKNYLRPKRA